MKNAILHRITNRNDFRSRIFDGARDYTPVIDSEDCKEVRELLQLNFKEHDYYVVSLLSAVEYLPEFSAAFAVSSQNYELARWSRPPTSISGGVLVPDQKGPPQVLRIVHTFPVHFDTTLEYADARTGFLTLDGVLQPLPVIASGDTLLVTWPTGSGISGNIKLSIPWETGAKITIYSTPRNVPFTKIAELLQNSQAALRLLQNQDLVTSFFTNPVAVERVATALVALGLSTPTS